MTALDDARAFDLLGTTPHVLGPLSINNTSINTFEGLKSLNQNNIVVKKEKNTWFITNYSRMYLSTDQRNTDFTRV